MRWPCTSRIRLSANPPRIAARTAAGSAPAACANKSASAMIFSVPPTISWLHSLATWPLPAGPTSIGRPIACSTGSAFEKSCTLPPAMMARVPASAPATPPDTGASRKWKPSPSSLALNATASSCRVELMSIHKAAGLSDGSAASMTWPTTVPDSSMEMTISAFRTASCKSGSAWAPRPDSAAALANVRFHARTWNPWPSRRAAIGAPIRPMPRKVIVGVVKAFPFMSLV